MLLVIIVGTGATVLATRFMKPQYTVQATIWIESPSGHGGPVRAGSVVEGTTGSSSSPRSPCSTRWLRASGCTLRSPIRRIRPLHQLPVAGAIPAGRVRPADRPRRPQLQPTLGRRTRRAAGKCRRRGRHPHRLRLDPADRPPRPHQGRKVTFKVTSPRDASLALREQLSALMKEQATFFG